MSAFSVAPNGIMEARELTAVIVGHVHTDATFLLLLA